MDNYSATLSGIFQAFADPTRRAVLAQLGQGSASVTELARPHDMALPSFMKHIQFLEEAGLIRTEKHGRVRSCALERGGFVRVESWLAEQRVIWESRTDRLEAFVTARRDET